MITADELVSKAVGLLRTNPYGFLVTVGASSQPHTRLVEHLDIEEDVVIWIGTSPRSRKVADLTARNEATYAVEDRTRFAYASITGRARLVADEEACRSRWVEGLRAFFPQGPTGNDFVLIELTATRVEVMDFTEGIHPDPYGLVPMVATRADRWQLATAERRT